MRRALLVSVAALAVGSCKSMPIPAADMLAIAIGGMQVMDTSRDAQCDLATQYEVSAGRRHRDSRDDAMRRKLQSIADRITEANQLSNFNYEVRFLRNNDPNAFTPGCGRIYVNEGFIALAETEAQMAMVMAHEIAHGEQAHSVEGRRDRFGMAVAAHVLTAAMGRPGSRLGQFAQELGISTVLSQYSQTAETEADIVGFEYFVNAGYRPTEAQKVFRNMKKKFGSRPGFMNAVAGSHPTPDARADGLQAMAKGMPAEGRKDTKEWRRLRAKYVGKGKRRRR